MLVDLKIHSHLKESCKSNIYGVCENISCFPRGTVIWFILITWYVCICLENKLFRFDNKFLTWKGVEICQRRTI